MEYMSPTIDQLEQQLDSFDRKQRAAELQELCQHVQDDRITLPELGNLVNHVGAPIGLDEIDYRVRGERAGLRPHVAPRRTPVSGLRTSRQAARARPRQAADIGRVGIGSLENHHGRWPSDSQAGRESSRAASSHRGCQAMLLAGPREINTCRYDGPLVLGASRSSRRRDRLAKVAARYRGVQERF